MRLAEVTREAILEAIAECDELGETNFLAKHGFRGARYLYLAHEGHRYPSKAIVAVAHARQFPDEAPLTAGDLSGGEQTTRVLERTGFEVVDGRTTDPKVAVAVWWVNQGHTYNEERQGGYVWAPQKTKAGFPVAHHTNVSRLAPNDVVVHYSKGKIQAVSRVSAQPVDQIRPNDLPEDMWESAGHYCEVEYSALNDPISLTEIPERPGDAGPFNSDGSVKQGYLFGLDARFADQLRSEFEGPRSSDE